MTAGKRIPPDLPRGGTATLALVGEAPGKTEIARGRPFCGPSGRLLNALLRRAGLSRWDCLVTNALDFKLPKNDIKAVATLTKAEARKALKEWETANGEHPFADHVLTPVAAGAYLPPDIVAEQLGRVRDELAATQPTVVVPMGGTGMWACLGVPGSGKVEKLRGSINQEVLTGRKAVPTYHPAAVMRQYGLRVPLLMDLSKAQNEAAKGPEIELPTRRLLVPETPADIRDWIADNLTDPGTLLATDIETFKGQIDCIGFASSRLEALTIPFINVPDFTSYWSDPADEAEALRYTAEILMGPWPKLLQYGTYDIQWIWERWGIPVLNYEQDTRLLHHALYPELPKDLATLGATYENERGWKILNSRKEDKRDA